MKILIKGTNWIGDAVMSIPAMRCIRCAFPDASIALHTRRWAEGIFQHSDFLDEIITVEKARSKVVSVVSQAKELRRREFDLGILLTNSFESALTLRSGGIKRIFGYRTDGRGILLSDPLDVPEWKNSRHESEYYLGLARHVVETVTGSGPPPSVFPPSLTFTETQKQNARKFLRGTGINTEKTLIALGAGSTNSLAKRWPPESFAELSDKLSRSQNAQVILLGSESESDVSQRIQELVTIPVHDLVGRTELALASAILSVSDLFISNDMGLAHIAGAVGIPTLTIFGPTNETTTCPLGPKTWIVRESVECSPCMLRTCPIDHRCMLRISPERVFESAIQILQNS